MLQNLSSATVVIGALRVKILTGQDFFLFLFHFELKILLANSEFTDQMPHSKASDLGLHCLLLSQK